MSERSGAGQAHKKVAEERTAQVAAEKDDQTEAAKLQQELNEADSAAEKIGKDVESGDTDDVSGAVRLNPYPAYEDRSLEDLRSLAKSRGVEINRDVEKAHLVHKLREKDPTNPQWDFMTLEDLRSAAKDADVQLDEDVERAHLVTELRAADTSGGVTVARETR